MNLLTTQTVSAFDARRKFGDLLIGTLQGKNYIVERNGKPVAAIVSIERYEQIEAERKEFFDLMEKTAGQINLSEEKTTKLVNKAIKTARSKK